MEKILILSVKPKYVYDIRNGKKTKEMRKSFAKDFKGWCYFYCTKGRPYLYEVDEIYVLDSIHKGSWGTPLNGKIVARFWYDSDKVEKFDLSDLGYEAYRGDMPAEDNFTSMLEKSCLTYDELVDYAGNKVFYAWQIEQLEIFDTPMELSEFYANMKDCATRPFIRCIWCKTKYSDMGNGIIRGDGGCEYSDYGTCPNQKITRPPQSWQYAWR